MTQDARIVELRRQDKPLREIRETVGCTAWHVEYVLKKNGVCLRRHPNHKGTDTRKLDAAGRRDLREAELMDICAWMQQAELGRLGWEGTKPGSYLRRMRRLVAMVKGEA